MQNCRCEEILHALQTREQRKEERKKERKVKTFLVKVCLSPRSPNNWRVFGLGFGIDMIAALVSSFDGGRGILLRDGP